MRPSDVFTVMVGMIILMLFGVIIGFDLGLSLAVDLGLRGSCETKLITLIDCTKLPSK